MYREKICVRFSVTAFIVFAASSTRLAPHPPNIATGQLLRARGRATAQSEVKA